jgi:hypothetical protein
MNNSNLLQLSVVVPIYFEEETVPEFYDSRKRLI